MRKWVSSGPTAWITSRLHRFGLDVGSVVPSGFEAYARVFHPATDSSGAPVRWHAIAAANGRSIAAELQQPLFNGIPARATTEAERLWSGIPGMGSMPLDLSGRLQETLSACTSTPDDCWFAVWYGYGGIGVPPGTETAFSYPGREFYLLRDQVANVVQTFDSAPWHYQSPNMWWPADRAWCVATEIDFPWTYVGGSAECVGELLDDPELEAVPAAIDEGNHMESPAEAAARWPVRRVQGGQSR